MPDFYVHETDRWLVFPHEIQGLTPEEILAHKPVDERFLEARLTGEREIRATPDK